MRRRLCGKKEKRTYCVRKEDKQSSKKKECYAVKELGRRMYKIKKELLAVQRKGQALRKKNEGNSERNKKKNIQ